MEATICSYSPFGEAKLKTSTNFLHPYRAIIIVQARLASQRFPRKVLADVCGQTVLEMCLNRCKRAQVGETVLAIPWEASSDDLAGLWVPIYRPPEYVKEWDVLSRFYGCALQYKPDIIVRVTADSPLVDPDLIREVVSLLKAAKADYCANEPCIQGLGSEAFTFEALEKAELNVSEDDPDREHVTSYMRILRKQARFYAEERNVNLSVDTPEDLERVREVVKALGPDCRTPAIVRYLDNR